MSVASSDSYTGIHATRTGRKRRWIERSWSGTGPSPITTHRGTGKNVHRIKVDEKAGYILTTSTAGGLLVTDLQEDRELWSLPDVSLD